MWNKYVQKSDNYKQQEFIASTAHFYNKRDTAQCKYFANLWFQSLLEVESTKHYDYFKTYFCQLSPAFLGDPVHAYKMRKLLSQFESRPEKSNLRRCLKEEIWVIERIIKLKQFYK